MNSKCFIRYCHVRIHLGSPVVMCRVEKLSVNLWTFVMLNRKNICGSTCQKPGIHKPVDLYRLTAIFGPAVKILPNLSQPVDLYRLTSTFRIYQKVSKTVETLTG